jgi:small-conductance mechanosensitive channel
VQARQSKRAAGGFLLALLLIAGVLVVYAHRAQLLPGYGTPVRIATVVILVIVGSAATHWVGSGIAPAFYRRMDPATAGTIGFVIRLFVMIAVIILALRIAGLKPATLAVGGAFTAIVLGLAAQQTLGSVFAGIVMQSTRPFRVGERVRLVGGAMAGSIEGTVSSLGLFYTTLAQGAARVLVPNSVLITLAVVPLREPDRVEVRVSVDGEASPQRIEQMLLESITVPTRYPPSVALEEVSEERVLFKVTATPLRAADGSQLAEEMLAALRHPSSLFDEAGAG